MPFMRPYLIPGMIESAGIPFIYKKLLLLPGTDPSGAPFKMPCTQVPLEVGCQEYYYPSYINISDQLPNIASGIIPFGSKVEHAEIKTDFTLTLGPTQRVGFYYSYECGVRCYQSSHTAVNLLCRNEPGEVKRCINKQVILV